MGQHSEIAIEEMEKDSAEYADQFHKQIEDTWQQHEISALQVFEKGLSKSQISSMAQNAVNDVLEKGNVLSVAEALSAMENFIKEVRADKRFTDYVREETAKTPKGFVSASGAKIELAETGTKYDFSKCEDPILPLLEESLEQDELKLKNRKEFLKTVPSEGLEILHEDELIKIYPPAKSSTSSFKVTLAK